MSTTIIPPTVLDGGAKSLSLVTEFILKQMKIQKELKPNSNEPLFIGFQGPQGCGKSHLCSAIPSHLASLSPPLNVVTLGLDDLYLPHQELINLHNSSPSNKLWNGRGQPGTHDLPLARRCMEELKRINDKIEGEAVEKKVELPIFEKSAYGGTGDRSTSTVTITNEKRVDIVILEGWMCGFPPLTSEALSALYTNSIEDPKSVSTKWGYDSPFMLEHKLEDLEAINDRLREYEEGIWKHLDCFVKLCPVIIGYTWDWRLQQEHNMKAKNGGIGMSDEEVKSFISRYMPGYELFLLGIEKNLSNTWLGRGLKITIGRQREVVRTEEF